MSHLVLMTTYAALVSVFFALLWRRGRQQQAKLFLQIFLGMMIGAMAEVRVFVPAPLADKARELLELSLIHI